MTRYKSGDINRLITSSMESFHAHLQNGYLEHAYIVLDSLNRLMPQDKDLDNLPFRKYGVIISDQNYEKVVVSERVVYCQNPDCKARKEGVNFHGEQLDRRDVTKAELIQKNLYHLHWSVKSIPVWRCPICKSTHDAKTLTGENILDIVEVEQILPNPRKVVPHPPRHDNTGIDTYNEWRYKMADWLTLYNGEIMSELTRYRNDMIRQGMMHDDNVDYGTEAEIEQ
ncbi:MAG: hypothetical protein F4Y18_02770 [Cenarchaeum sp. SB0663_bin_5]|nr:hypothetical protein [Cenarchaeum sp. SB0663_bin_5]MYL11505.1 hypothetical protein [Cenarchaeum sp. SB0669_bin_11]